jgi:predicted ArsR family transcriptional regulator
MNTESRILASVAAGNDTPAKISSDTGIKEDTVRRRLTAMRRLGLIVRDAARPGRGRWGSPCAIRVASAADLEQSGDEDMEIDRRWVSADKADPSIVHIAIASQPMLFNAWR